MQLIMGLVDDNATSTLLSYTLFFRDFCALFFHLITPK